MKDMLKVISINTALLFGVILRRFRAGEIGGVAVHANKKISRCTTHVKNISR